MPRFDNASRLARRWAICSSWEDIEQLVTTEDTEDAEVKTRKPTGFCPPVLRVHRGGDSHRSSFFLIPSSIPLMNFTDSSVLNVRASSSASLITTAGGVSGSRISSHTAM